jgi:hypothetical protein
MPRNKTAPAVTGSTLLGGSGRKNPMLQQKPKFQLIPTRGPVSLAGGPSPSDSPMLANTETAMTQGTYTPGRGQSAPSQPPPSPSSVSHNQSIIDRLAQQQFDRQILDAPYQSQQMAAVRGPSGYQMGQSGGNPMLLAYGQNRDANNRFSLMPGGEPMQNRFAGLSAPQPAQGNVDSQAALQYMYDNNIGQVKRMPDGRLALTGTPASRTVTLQRRFANQERINTRRAARGGMSERQHRDLLTLERSGDADVVERYADRNGLLRNERTQTIVDRMRGRRESENASLGIGISNTGMAFHTPVKSPGKYSESDMQGAEDRVLDLETFPSLQALGITSDTDFQHDTDSLLSNSSDMSKSDFQDWASMYHDKTIRTNGGFTNGMEGSVFTNDIAKAIDRDDFEEVARLIAELESSRGKSKRETASKDSLLNPLVLGSKAVNAAGGKLRSIPIPASPNTGKL